MGGDLGVRLIAALNHDVRRTILRLLSDAGGPLSPAVISRMTGIPLSTVSYHVNILRQCGVVEQARTQPVRGTVEHFYKSMVEENKVANVLLEETLENDQDKDVN